MSCLSANHRVTRIVIFTVTKNEKEEVSLALDSLFIILKNFLKSVIRLAMSGKEVDKQMMGKFSL